MPKSSEASRTEVKTPEKAEGRIPAAAAGLDQLVFEACGALAEPASAEIIRNVLLESELINPEQAAGTAAALSRLKAQGLVDAGHGIPASRLEPVTRASQAAGRFPRLAAAASKLLPAETREGGRVTTSPSRLRRDLRAAVLACDVEAFHYCLLRWFQSGAEYESPHPLVQILNQPFDGDWFGGLPPQVQLYALHEILKHSLLHLEPVEELLRFLRDPAAYARIPKTGRPSFRYMAAILLLFRGQLADVETLLAEAGPSLLPFGLHGSLAFARGRMPEAMAGFDKELLKLRKQEERPESFFTGPEGLFCLLAWLSGGNYALLGEIDGVATSLAAMQPHNVFLPAYKTLHLLAGLLEHPLDLASIRKQLDELVTARDSITTLFLALFGLWTEGTCEPKLLERVRHWFELARVNGYDLLAAEYGDILCRAGKTRHHGVLAAKIRSRTGISPFLELLPAEEPWQRALRALNAAAGGPAPQPDREPETRLCWFLQVDADGSVRQITPREQKTRAGGWSRGRTMAIRRLMEGAEDLRLSDQDRRVRDTITEQKMTWGISYEFDIEKTLYELVGHPLLFLDSAPRHPIELFRGLPELCLEERQDVIRLFFFPPLAQSPVQLVRETPARFRFFPILRRHRRIARILGPDGLSLPASAREKILQIVRGLSPHVTIHSDIIDLESKEGAVEGSPRIHLLLTPAGEGIRIAFHVRPLENSGPYLKPGMGQQSIMARQGGKVLMVRRDLEAERTAAAATLAAVPGLSLFETEAYEYEPPSPEDCLQILLELRGIQDTVVMEWPQGRKLTVSPQVGFDQLHLALRRKGDWFEMDGRLELDEGLVLDMKKLLDLVRRTPGRFVPIGPGQFLSLSRELRRRLEDMNSLAEHGKKHIRFHPLAALALEELADEGVQVETDEAWREQIRRIREAGELTPKVPATLLTTLRAYQVEGYQWLARLAHWGVGACLADDMGLGKTVQALAIILERAAGGPSLVVAPTSVCMNWLDEAKRFAPTLNVVMLGGKDRGRIIDALKPHDLLVMSYSLLQQEEENLSARQFRTIVLDEAQAIKNMATKRSRAAMNLKGEFRVITTGTPIENNLEELWNLFRFINPGLLGSIAQFRERFEIPISRRGERESRRLKRLIQPFILRRVKSEVLDELPPRTEMLLRVEMSREERAFYEALRRQAVERIAGAGGPPGARNLNILREIMRLRLACCHPRLVAAETEAASTKLDIFGKVVGELVENKHRALVFSQFVGFLTLIREYLDGAGIRYRYLDGSTPAKERRLEVQAFQEGDGDLFLISLRAGGLGLNLTAADYVIHMDPWWNPAVEDQASDRAHRIGQRHPVTVYRLIMRNSIEEKIVKLHQEKRELADGLLAGANVTSRLTTEELLTLLEER